ncbi:hypothetical protein [Georgenia subflava]|uniref:LSDAT prokaryote domain-containing protein n=1 Tax=Georgenia subflava TaxID=1622177 RepID=A0A6N7EKA1_9MICO|nr:hypothetical protein [Georgenia subflava]MPV35694.1 hypothetical protein [Georgenia subflava]
MTAVVRRVAVTADLGAALGDVVEVGGRAVVVLVGGAGGMDADALDAVTSLLTDHVVPLVVANDGVVVDGGTDTGVMRAMGQARTAAASAFPLVGVVAAGTVVLPGEPQRPGAFDTEPRHSHVIVVPGEDWGDESRWLDRVAALLAGPRPSVTLLLNGGAIAAADAARSIARGRPVVVAAGTGRLADAVAAAAVHTGAAAGTAGDVADTDADARAIAASPLTRVVPVIDGAALAAALAEVLGQERPQPSAAGTPSEHGDRLVQFDQPTEADMDVARDRPARDDVGLGPADLALGRTTSGAGDD